MGRWGFKDGGVGGSRGVGVGEEGVGGEGMGKRGRGRGNRGWRNG